MARRATYTIVYLGAQRTDRVDFGAAPDFALLSQRHLSAESSDDPVTRLEAVLIAEPKIAKKVWVLWENASVQFLDLQSGVIEGLEREELAEVLGFEAETLTMVPAAESAIDGVPQLDDATVLPEFRRFLTTQIQLSIRDKMAAAVKRVGGLLIGIAHPGGLPRQKFDAAKSAPSGAWNRIEVWEQLSVFLHGKKDGSVQTRLMRSSPGSDVWTAELPKDSAFTLLGSVAEHLLPIGPDGLHLHPEKIEFAADAAPVDWLRAWASELHAPVRRVPVIEPPSGISPNRLLYVVGGIAAAVTLTLCAAHGGYIYWQTSNERARATQLEATRLTMMPVDNSPKEEAQVNAETAKLRTNVQELEKREAVLLLEKEKAEKLIADVAARQTRLGELQAVHRPAVGELLGALADAEHNVNAGDVVVKEVRQDGNGDLRLTGLCSRSALSDTFATKLETRLSKSGWKVGAAQKRLRDDRLAFNFSILLTPAVLADLSPAETLKNRNKPAKVVTTVAEPQNQNRLNKSAVEGNYP